LRREAAERVYTNGQAIQKDRGNFVRELVLVDHHPAGADDGAKSSNSSKSSYKEMLSGGSLLKIETAGQITMHIPAKLFPNVVVDRRSVAYESKSLAREVVTQPCRVYKLKPIRSSLRPLYMTVVREATGNDVGQVLNSMQQRRSKMAGSALSITKISRVLDVSENTARRLIKSGQIRASRVGQQWRVQPGDLENYLAEHSNQLGDPGVGSVHPPQRVED
jgi:excisionase family DNA binding protein